MKPTQTGGCINLKTAGIRRSAGILTGISRPPSRISPLAAAVLTALYTATPALAQDRDAIEEIIVTATKREGSLQDVAQSISVLTADDIERRAFQDTEDFIRALPNVGLNNSMPGRNAIFMRGIATGAEEFHTDSQVAIYLDEQPVTTNSQQLDVRLIDIARIEALPGPQGTLFGSTSQTGTVRIITNKPDHGSFSGQIEGEVATTKNGEESFDVNGYFNLPLAEDRLAVRAAAFYTDEGGYIDNVPGATLEGSATNAGVAGDDINDYENYGGRIAALWTVNDRVEANLSLIAQSSTATGTWLSDPFLGDYEITRFYDEYREDDWYQVSLTLTADLGFAELTSTTSYFDRDIAYEFDNTIYSQFKDSYYGNYYPLFNTEYLVSSRFNDQSADRVAQEVRLASTGDSRLEWLVGFFYEEVNDKWLYGARVPGLDSTQAWATAQYYAYYYNNYGYNVQYPLPATDYGYSQKFDKTVEQVAVFGEVTFNLTDDWSVTGGARWFQFDREESDINQFPHGLPVDVSPNFGFGSSGVYASSATIDDIMFKAGTRYHFDENRMVYFLFSEGFRLGGNNNSIAAAAGFVPQEYQPDTLTNYELGIKSRWLDNRLTLNASVFFMEWDRIQLAQFDGVGPWWLRGTTNGDGAESLGVEVNASWNVTDNLLLEGSAFVADAEFTGNTPLATGNVVEDGRPMPLSPESKLYFAAEYTLPNRFGGDWRFRYDFSYEASKYNNLTSVIDSYQAGKIPSWDLSNVQVSYALNNGWEFTLMARNLFNQDAVNSLRTDDDHRPQYFGDPRFQALRTVVRPRTIGLNIRKRF